MTLRVRRAVVDALVTEANAAYLRDEEACGYLTGPADDELLVDEAVPMPNLANRYHAMDPEAYPRTGRDFFILDPLKFKRAVEAGEASGRPVKVLWHSHPDVGAYFSETDAKMATMAGDSPTYDLFYWVTSVRREGVDDHKLFAWDPSSRSFVETGLRIEE